MASDSSFAAKGLMEPGIIFIMDIAKKAKIAITGGAGYIGSFTVKYFQSIGFNNLVILDNFSTGHKEACFARCIDVNLLDRNKLNDIFDKERFEAVIHFASLTVVPHSMTAPYIYFYHNINTSLNLLEAMADYGVSSIVFSSSCSVYGTPHKLPIAEDEPVKPDSVYAETKLMIEKIIQWYSKIYGIKYALLRYFNACGAAADASYGERHAPETHLIPSAILNLLQGQPIEIYGNDYDTPDKTCIRDYIHIDDLAEAHYLALKHITNHKTSDIFNLGVGEGKSNLEIVQTVIQTAKAFGIDGHYLFRERRIGDVPVLYSDSSKAKQVLGWRPKRTDIKKIVEEAFKWHVKQTNK